MPFNDLGFIEMCFSNLLGSFNFPIFFIGGTTLLVIQQFFKLYGGEIAFKRIIQGLREMEISNYRRLSIGKSFESALSSFVGIVSGFLMYIVAHYAGT